MAWHKESKRHSEVQRKPSRFSKAQIEADYNSVSKPEFQTHKYTPDFQKAGTDLKKALDAGKFTMFGQQKVENVDLVAIANSIGKNDFRKGLKRVPALSKELMALLEANRKLPSLLPLTKAWCDGWDYMNLENDVVEFPLPDLKNNEKKEAYDEFLVYMDDGGEPTAFRYNDDGDLEVAVGSDWYLQKEVSKGIFNSLGKYVPSWIRNMDA